MKPLLGFVLVATLCFAGGESRVSRAAIQAVESSINEMFSPQGADPYDLLGNGRGTYLEGYGALFTVELDLVSAGGLVLSPFKRTISPEEIAGMSDRKMKKLPELKDQMRTLMVRASTMLEGIPPDERVAMEAILFNFSWEKNGREMPHRIFMSAERQKLLDANAGHATQAELASIIEEQDR